MSTYSALTTLDDKARAEALADAMEAFEPEPTGVGCFEIEDGSGRYEVGAYFEQAPDEVALALMAAAFSADPFIVSEVPETDWVAHVKRNLQPVVAGRFFVYGSHDADRVPRLGRRVVEEKVDTRRGPVHHARRFQRGLGPGEVLAPDQDVHVLRVADRGLVDGRDPRRDRVAADNRVRHARFGQGARGEQQPLADSLHGVHHALKDVGLPVRTGHGA